MSYGRATTRNLTAAIRLGRDYLPVRATACEVGYDKKTHTWSAWYSELLENGDTRQIGFSGHGRDPIHAVEALIEINSTDSKIDR